MEIKRALPRPFFRSVVRSFEERRANLSAALSWPVAARPHLILDVHLANPYGVSANDGPISATPQIQVVGPQTFRRAKVYLKGEIHVFNICFQPTGLNRLLGINMTALVNEDPAAADILGRSITSVLNDSVRAAADFPSRIDAVEHWLSRMMDNCEPDRGIDQASVQLMVTSGRARIDAIIGQSGLSARQFQRKFTECVGLTPKLFARTVRFDKALRAHRHDPARSWTDIAHDSGYFDQAHLVHECRAFAGVSPSGIAGDWENVFFPADGRNIQAPAQVI